MGREKVGSIAYREGNYKYKNRNANPVSIELQRFLKNVGLHVPEVYKIDENGEVESEWFEGTDFGNLWQQEKLTDEDWYKCGRFLAKMNNYGISSHDLFFKNLLKCDNGEVTLCDWNKLYKTTFPEEPIVIWFLNNYHPYFKSHVKEPFVQGYKTIRPLDMLFLIEKEIEVNCDNYQDVYFKGVLLRQGARSYNRLKFLPASMHGLKVLDLGCSLGMFALESKRRGAEFVRAIEQLDRGNERRLIDLPGLIAYAEDLDIQFICDDIECSSVAIFEKPFDIIFFCAMLGHLKGDREAYVKKLKNNTKILYYETNLGGNEEQHYQLLTKIGFSKIERLGESGDPDRDPKNLYKMFRCYV